MPGNPEEPERRKNANPTKIRKDKSSKRLLQLIQKSRAVHIAVRLGKISLPLVKIKTRGRKLARASDTCFTSELQQLPRGS